MDEVINQCMKMEKAVASVYQTFMQMFPKERDFWEDLFNDEVDHFSFLKSADYLQIHKDLDSGVLPPSMPLIEKTLRFVNDINIRIKTGPFTFEDALKTALKLEETMVETFANELIAYLSVTDDELVTEKILLGERMHIDKIREKMISKGITRLS
jgi:hypothetical protein